MSLSSEHQSGVPSIDVDTFASYVVAQTERLASAQATLTEAQTLFEEGYGSVNERLMTAGRGDLAIKNPVKQMQPESPQDIFNSFNNFTPSFRIRTGFKETGRMLWKDKPEREDISPTKDEVLQLRDLPLITDYDELADIEESGRFACINKLITSSHAHKPYFTRSLILFPNFVSDLTVTMSSSGQNEQWTYFGSLAPELFIGYQIMSRLVDASDLSVIRSDGPDNWFLAR